jgi:hypothetical protein
VDPAAAQCGRGTGAVGLGAHQRVAAEAGIEGAALQAAVQRVEDRQLLATARGVICLQACPLSSGIR